MPKNVRLQCLYQRTHFSFLTPPGLVLKKSPLKALNHEHYTFLNTTCSKIYCDCQDFLSFSWLRSSNYSSRVTCHIMKYLDFFHYYQTEETLCRCSVSIAGVFRDICGIFITAFLTVHLFDVCFWTERYPENVNYMLLKENISGHLSQCFPGYHISFCCLYFRLVVKKILIFGMPLSLDWYSSCPRCRKIHRKTAVTDLFFNKVAGGAFNFIKKETLTQVFSCEFCEVF